MKYKIHITIIGLWLALLLSTVAAYAQLRAKVGDTTTLSVSEVSSDTYTWELYDVSQNVNFATTAGNCPASKAQFVGGNIGNSVQVQWLAPGEYFYKVTAQNSCSNNIKIGRMLVEGKPLKPKKVEVAVSYDCTAGTAELRALKYEGALLWSTGEDKESIIVSKGGTYTVVQIVNGIKSEPTLVKIIDSIAPRVNLIAEAVPPMIIKGGKSKLIAKGCIDGTVRWYTDSLLTKELLDTTVSPEVTTTYYVACENEVGCLSQPEKVTVEVNPFDDTECQKMYEKMTITQFVSPNGDGKNDVWRLDDLIDYCAKCNKIANVRLYNRWGAKVYEKTSDKLDKEPFDGYSQNVIDYIGSKRLPDGVYFYIIIVENQKEKTGYIYITTQNN